MKLKNIKIVQVGVSNHYFEESFINTAKKTSFDELCTILKNSLLHIDIDGACTHISKALGTKSIVLFGPTCAKYLGYPENINITSSLCRDCYHFIDNTFWGKCLFTSHSNFVYIYSMDSSTLFATNSGEMESIHRDFSCPSTHLPQNVLSIK